MRPRSAPALSCRCSDRVELLGVLEGVAVRPDGAVVSSRLVAEPDGSLAVQVEGHDRATLRLPGGARREDSRRLIHVDEPGRLHVLGGEAPGRPGTLLVYASDGTLEQTISPPPDLLPLESRAAGYRGWTVDGRAYIPITDGQGVKVLRSAVRSGGIAPDETAAP